MKTRGFTLIELLLVVAIISLLSSVVLASLKDARNKAISSALISEIRSLYQESEIYFVGGNSYAPSSQGTDGTTACPTSVNSSWGFFGTQKGLDLVSSIKNRVGSSNINCAVTPQSWAIITGVYVPLLTEEKTNTAYAQTLLGYICFDSSTKTIRNDVDVLEGSDGETRIAPYTIQLVGDRVVCGL